MAPGAAAPWLAFERCLAWTGGPIHGLPGLPRPFSWLGGTRARTKAPQTPWILWEAYVKCIYFSLEVELPQNSRCLFCSRPPVYKSSLLFFLQVELQVAASLERCRVAPGSLCFLCRFEFPILGAPEFGIFGDDRSILWHVYV